MREAPGAGDPWRVTAALLAVQLLFGVHYLAAKWVVGEMVPAAWACLRVLSTFAILLPLTAALRRPWPSRRDWPHLAVLALFGVVLNQALFLEGVARATTSHASVINSQIPSFALLAAVLLGQERLTPRKALSFVLGIAGVLVLLEADRLRFRSETMAGDLLFLANSASYGLYVALSRPVMRRVDPFAATTVIFGMSCLGMLAYGGRALAAADLGALSGRAWGAMIFSVLGATVLTYFLNAWSIRRTHTSHVALYIFLQPIIATLLGVFVLGERVGARLVVAMALVFLALILRDSRNQSKMSDGA